MSSVGSHGDLVITAAGDQNATASHAFKSRLGDNNVEPALLSPSSSRYAAMGDFESGKLSRSDRGERLVSSFAGSRTSSVKTLNFDMSSFQTLKGSQQEEADPGSVGVRRGRDSLEAEDAAEPGRPDGEARDSTTETSGTTGDDSSLRSVRSGFRRQRFIHTIPVSPLRGQPGWGLERHGDGPEEFVHFPDSLGKMLKGLPDPQELAPLLRFVISTASTVTPHFPPEKSFTRIPRSRTKSAAYLSDNMRPSTRPSSYNIKVGQIGRRKAETVPLMPTYRLEPAAVPHWRAVKTVVTEVLVQGLKGVRYDSFVAAAGCRILAATILNRIKDLNFERYRLVVDVRIVQKLNLGMTMQVACLWDPDTDIFSCSDFENPSLLAQAVVYLVYRE